MIMTKLTQEELKTIINVLGQVSVPIVSQQANAIRLLINKVSKMVDEAIKLEEPKKEDKK